MSSDGEQLSWWEWTFDLVERAEPYLFWVLLAVATFVSIRPFWVSAIPPFDDLGGHLAMADAWARLEDVELYREIYERRTGLVPNTVFARFTSWLHPIVAPIVSLRLFLSLIVVSTVGTMYACTRVFRRSPWVLFLALPFIWNGSIYYGMVNYIPTFPLFFGGVALAAKTGETGDWRWGVGLGVLSLFSFFAHGLGVLFVVSAAACMLVLSVRRWRYLGWLGAFVPTVMLWVRWRGDVEGRGAPDAGLYELVMKHGEWFGPIKTLKYVVRRGIDIVQSNQDLWCFVVLMTIWVVFMGVSDNAESLEERRDATVVSAESWFEAIHGLSSAVWHHLYRYRWLLMVVSLWGAVILFPAYIKMTDIKMRLIGLFFWSAALLPRLPRKNVVAGVATAVAVAASLWFGQFVTDKVRTFQTQELAPLVELIDKVPEQSKVQCIRVYQHDQDWLFRVLPLGHNCAGLVHVRRSGFGGFHFPGTAFNPIKFKKGFSFTSIGRGKWTQLGRLQAWDYAIVRGTDRTLPDRIATRVATAGGGTKDGIEVTTWQLFKIESFEDLNADGELFGGSSGIRFRWRCPADSVLAGIRGSLRPRKTLGTVTPICRRLGAEGPTRSAGRMFGPSIGMSRGGGRYTAVCPKDEYVVGLSGATGLFVDRVNIECAPLAQSENEGLVWDRDARHRIEGGGGSGGESFEWTCPSGTIATGIQGRHGAWIDAIGLLCERIEQIDVSVGDDAPEQ